MNANSYVMLPGIALAAGLLFAGAAILFIRDRRVTTLLQLLGGSGLLVVVLAHVAEALQLLPAMGWGLLYSAGHYVDAGGAALGLTLFPVGYLAHALTGDGSR